MFGYIRPMECELKVREQSEYRAYYCGLCKQIGARYGLLARMLLNYDCAFLAAFLSAMQAETPFCNKRCHLRPLRKKQPMACQSPALAYAADVNVLLSWYAALDQWRDSRNIGALLLKLLFNPSRRRAEALNPALAAEINRSLKRLGELEASNAACTDEPSDAFGELMRQVILHAPGLDEATLRCCGWMFYNLGRWVYLADAWDDRQKDRKRGEYNPFLAAGTSEADAEFLLNVSLAEMEKAFDLLEFPGQHGLVDNIVYLGCRMRTRLLLHKENVE